MLCGGNNLHGGDKIVIMEKIGWWFLRHSRPRQKTYFCACPKCKIFIPMSQKQYTKNKGLHSCGTRLEIIEIR